MPRKKTEEKELLKKLEYLGLDLKNIPQSIKKVESLKNASPKFSNEKQYRQYKFIPVKDIQILISSANVSDTIQEKYKKARPLTEYIDAENENNSVFLQSFLEMIDNMEIEDVKKIEKEQSDLNKKIPFKVKFENDFLWPIYYLESIDKYVMIVLEKSTDYSTFFYILKKQLSKRPTGKVYVPISNIGYSNEYLKKTQFKKIEDYLWTLTADWPLVYEVFDKNADMSLQIVGEVEVYNNIKSWYKVKIEEKAEAVKFYNLIETMATIKKELPDYYNFKAGINKKGELEIYFDNQKIETENLADWINEQYIIGIKNKNDLENRIIEKQTIYEQEKSNFETMQIEYLAKEKQITTFLQCKKSFFGKFKYFFKYGKNKNKKNKSVKQKNKENNTINITEKETKLNKNKNYKVEELIELYKQNGILKEELKNLSIELKNILLKNKNLKKKIENATLYINEIDNHKKSIFEFWKFSNKDEVHKLVEGEDEEVNVVKNVNTSFNYDEDFEYFGKIQDRLQRKHLTKEEKDSVFVANTEVLEVLNKIRNNEVLPDDIEKNLNQVKKRIGNEEETDIVTIKMRKHKEKAKNLIDILDVKKTTRKVGYKLVLDNVLENLNSAIEKISTTADFTIYKATLEENLRGNDLCVFNINSNLEIQKALETGVKKINLYKINLKEKSNAVFYTNSIFYDNENKTLPVGMNLSTNVLVDLSKIDLQIARNSSFKILEFEDENDDFSNIVLKTVNILEYNTK